MLWWDAWLFSVRCLSGNLHSFFAEVNKAGPSWGEVKVVFIVTTRFTSCLLSLTVLHLRLWRLWPNVIESQSIKRYQQLKLLHIWPMNNQQVATHSIKVLHWGKHWWLGANKSPAECALVMGQRFTEWVLLESMLLSKLHVILHKSCILVARWRAALSECNFSSCTCF